MRARLEQGKSRLWGQKARMGAEQESVSLESRQGLAPSGRVVLQLGFGLHPEGRAATARLRRVT